MAARPVFVMTDVAHFDVSYQINPWMRPEAWLANPGGQRARAIASSRALQAAISATPAQIELIPAAPGLPDLVFPANAAIVLDGFFRRLVDRGLIDRIATLPDNVWQEGAGDAIWDAERQHFWIGHGQRSSRSATVEIEAVFGRPTVELELVSPRFYHLDTCFCPLDGGDVLYYPPAFSAEGLATIHDHVAPAQRIEATDEDAAAFCVNAVTIGRRIVLARAPARLRARLVERGDDMR
jgi:N-dimethylarginine dimethylaminohydrolase